MRVIGWRLLCLLLRKEQLPRRAEEAAAAAGEAPTRAEEEPQPFVLNVRGFLEVVGITGPSLTISSVSPQVKHYGGQPSVTPPTRRTLPATGATVKAPAAAKPSAAAAAGARTTAAAKAPAAAVKPSPRAAQTPARVVAAAKTAATVAGEGEGKQGVLGRLQPATGRGTEEKAAESRPNVGAARVRASSEGNKKQETATTQQQEGTATRVTTGRGPGEKATLTEEAVEAKPGEKAAAAARPPPKLLKKPPLVVQPKRVPTVAAAGAGESQEQHEAETPKPQPKLVKKSPPATLPKTESAAEEGPGEKDGEKAAAPKPEPKLVKKPPPVTLKKVAATPAKAGDGKQGKEAKDAGVEESEKEKGETAAKKNEKAADKEGAVPAGEEEKIKKAPTVVGSRKPTGEKKAALQASKPASADAKTESQQQPHQEEKQEAGKPRAKAAPGFPAAKGAGKAPATAIPPAENGAGKAAREQAAKAEKADEASNLEGTAKDVKPSEATKKEEKDAKAVVTKRSQSGLTVTTKEGTAASKGGAVPSAAKQALAKAVKETQSKGGLKTAVAVPSKTEASATTRKETQAEAATEGDKKLGATTVLKAAVAEGGAAAVAKQKKEGLAGLKKKGEAKDASPDDTKKAGAGARAAKPATVVAEKKVLKGKDAKQGPPPTLVATKKAAPTGTATVAPPGPPGLKNAKAAVLRKAKEEEGGDAYRVGSPVGKKLKAKKKEGESSTASSGSEGSKTGKKIARAAAGEKEAGAAGKKQKKAAPRKLLKKGETLKATVTATKKPVPNLRKKASIRVAGAYPTEHPSAEKGIQHRKETSPQQEEGKRLRPQEKLPQKQEEEKLQKRQDGRVQKQQEEEVNRQRERPETQQKGEPRRPQEELQQKHQEEKFKEQQNRLVHHQKEALRQQQEGLQQQPRQPEENLMQQWEPLQEQQRLKQNKAANEKSVNEAGTLLADRPTDAKLQKKHSKEQVPGRELGRGVVSATESDSAVVGTKEREKLTALSSERQRQEQPPHPQGITVPSTMEKSLDEAEMSPLKIKEPVEEEAKREAETEQSQRAESKMLPASPHSFFPFPSWCTTPPPAASYNLRSKPWPSQDVLVQRLSPVQKRMEEHTAMMLQNHGVWLPPRKREKAAKTDLSASSCANKSKALHYLGFCCCCQSCQTDLHSDRRTPASHITAKGERRHLPSGAAETPAVEHDTETQVLSTKIHAAPEAPLPHEQHQQIVEAVGQQQPTITNGWAEGSPCVSYQGYYDEAGNWISTPQRYYDETGNWVSSPARADVSASVEQSPQDAGDSYPQGHFVQGFYDENNNWVQGYYDEMGNWVWVPTVQQTQ